MTTPDGDGVRPSGQRRGSRLHRATTATATVVPTARATCANNQVGHMGGSRENEGSTSGKRVDPITANRRDRSTCRQRRYSTRQRADFIIINDAQLGGAGDGHHVTAYRTMTIPEPPSPGPPEMLPPPPPPVFGVPSSPGVLFAPSPPPPVPPAPPVVPPPPPPPL
jgi:hypothetical protein